MSRGKFIVFEGLDGAGKTTALNNLYDYLSNNSNREVIKTREPGGTTISEELREILLKDSSDVSDKTALSIVTAARSHHVETLIKPAIEAGKIVLCDRYFFSTMVYQVLSNASNHKLVKLALDMQDTLVGLDPNMILFFDVNYETSKKRIMSRGDINRLDALKEESFNNRRRLYEHAREWIPDDVYFSTINGEKDEGGVLEDVLDALGPLIVD